MCIDCKYYQGKCTNPNGCANKKELELIKANAESKAYTRVLDILEQLDNQMCEKVKDMLYEQDYQEFAKEKKQ